MPQVAGFRGVLFDPTRVELAKVVAPPSESVPAAARPTVAADPHSALHLANADDGATLAAWLATGILQRDPTRAVYRYHQAFRHPELGDRTVVRKMLVAAVKLAPWSEGVIRPHAATSPAHREQAARAIAANRGQIEPVLAGYLDAAGEVERIMRKHESERPTLEVTTADGTAHKLWRVASAETIGKLRPLFAPKKLHVLEGHARYEAMVEHAAALEAKAPMSLYSAGSYGLMALVDLDDPVLLSVARHRIVRGAINQDAVLADARRYFIVEPIAGVAKDAARLHRALTDTLAHQPAFVLSFAGDADAWKLTLSPEISPQAEGVTIHRALAKLDPVIVDAIFVGKVLGGSPVQVTTETDAAAALAQVHGGGAQLAIITRAVPLDQIKHTTELNAQLPAGSTAFYPRLATGLVMNLVDPDEDLV